MFKKIKNLFKDICFSSSYDKEWEDMFDQINKGFFDNIWQIPSQSQSIIRDGENTFVETNGEVIKLKGNPNVTIKNSKVYINGKEIDKSQYRTKHNHITVILEGDVENLNSDGWDADIHIIGNVGNNVKSSNGDIKVEGTVNGDVLTTNGDITVNGTIGKSVSTINGDIINN